MLRMAQRSENTRDHIIEIAEKLLFEGGFSGTSLNDIMNAADLTKGAFFHHFKGKDELAHAVLTRWADNDDDLVREFSARAESLAETPLQEAIIFIKLFEEWLTNLEEPLSGCLFASFTYESARFDPAMHEYIRDRLRIWMGLYAPIFDRLARSYDAKAPDVTGETITEMLATLFEGGLLLTRALGDRLYLVRQLESFRSYLTLLYGDGEGG